MQIISELMEQALHNNAAVTQEQDEFKRRFNALDQRYREAETKLDAVSEQIKDKLLRKAQIDDFFRSLEGNVIKLRKTKIVTGIKRTL